MPFLRIISCEPGRHSPSRPPAFTRRGRSITARAWLPPLAAGLALLAMSWGAAFYRPPAAAAQQQATFADVPPEHWAFPYVEYLYQQGYISGCSVEPRLYCPEQITTRAHSAVFVLRGLHGAGYLPPEPQERVFADVALGTWPAKWATQLWQQGYTAGCSEQTLLFCPDRTHSHAEAAVFFLRMLRGAAYQPPPARGLFADVPDQAWYRPWTEAAYAAGLLPLCQAGPEPRLCPETPLTRARAAFMMARAKGYDPLTEDFLPPQVDELLILPRQPQQEIQLQWRARDEQGLREVQLWRTAAQGEACRSAAWQLVQTFDPRGASTASGLFQQAPPPGRYCYQMILLDTASNPGFSPILQVQRAGEVPGAADGIWLSAQELSRLPTQGPAWEALLQAAGRLPAMEARGGHGSTHDVHTMAAALVAARLQDQERKAVVAAAIRQAMQNQVELDGNSLSLTRTLPGYIIAADLIDLSAFDPQLDTQFRQWLRYVVYELELDGSTQIDKHRKANNHGTQAAVVRLAADLYLGEQEDFAQAAEMFKAWLGHPSSYTEGFNWGDLCWQADPSRPVGINPKGARMFIAGAWRDVDGVQPDEQRRSGCPGDRWPPPEDVHVWGGLQGVVGQAMILSRQGYPDVWQWADQAILRAVSWQFDPQRGDAPAKGDDLWILPVVDCVYGTSFWSGGLVGYGKQVGWTDWTHSPGVCTP